MSKLSDLVKQSKVAISPQIKTQVSKPGNTTGSTIVLGGITHTKAQNSSPTMSIFEKAYAKTKDAEMAQRTNTSAPSSIGDIELNIRSDVADWPHEQDENYSDSVQEQLQIFLAQVNESLVTDDVSNAMQRCLIFIKTHPETANFLLPEDIGLMTRALQSSHGIVIAKKQNRSKAKSQTQEEVDKLTDALTDLGDWKM